jgi:hypothetical protein
MPLVTQLFLIALLLFFTLYLLYEWVRWVGGNSTGLTVGQFRRRMVGGGLLEVALLMWLLYPYFIARRPAAEQLLYLLSASLLTVVPMMLAVREAAFVTRQYVRWHGEMIRNHAPGKGPGTREPDVHDA